MPSPPFPLTETDAPSPARQFNAYSIAAAIADAVRTGIESGRFAVQDGVVILAESHTIAPGGQREHSARQPCLVVLPRQRGR